MHLPSLVALTAVSVVQAATYDYIVVGSGPGGGPLAANLAKAGYSTLLIEAGGDEGSNPTYADIANFLESANDEATRWDFFVKHSDDPKRDLQYKYNTWDTGDGTFYVGRNPPEGAKVSLLNFGLEDSFSGGPPADLSPPPKVPRNPIPTRRCSGRLRHAQCWRRLSGPG